jgi:nucleoid DNA-binding protein
MASVKTKAVKAKPKSKVAVAPSKVIKAKPKAVKKASVVKATATTAPITAKQNESQILKAVAEDTGLKLIDVKEVFVSLNALLFRHMKKRGSGEFKVPKLGVKVRRIKKPATKARMGRNPATGEEIKIAAKPSRSVVKATVLKALKEMIEQ